MEQVIGDTFHSSAIRISSICASQTADSESNLHSVVPAQGPAARTTVWTKPRRVPMMSNSVESRALPRSNPRSTT